MTPRAKKNLVAVILSLLVALSSPIAGLAASRWLVDRAFQGAAGVEASRRAQSVAEGISYAMAGVVVGGVIGLLGFGAAVFFAIRLFRGARAAEG